MQSLNRMFFPFGEILTWVCQWTPHLTAIECNGLNYWFYYFQPNSNRDFYRTLPFYGVEGPACFISQFIHSMIKVSQSSLSVIGKSNGFWLSLIVNSSFSNWLIVWFCLQFVSVCTLLNNVWKWLSHISPFWMGNSSWSVFFRLFQLSQNWFVFTDFSIIVSCFWVYCAFLVLSVCLYCFSVAQ